MSAYSPEPRRNVLPGKARMMLLALSGAVVFLGGGTVGFQNGAAFTFQYGAQAAPVPSIKLKTADERAEEIAPAANTALIHRLLPNAEIRNVDKLDMGMGTYVWEVELLADKSNPQSSGFAYLSADGEKLINGPLMDKRSRVMTTTSAPSLTAQPAAVSKTASAPVSEARIASAQQPTEPELPAEPSTNTTDEEPAPSEAMVQQAVKAAGQREAFYKGLSNLPYISTTQGSHIVYVMFDPLCPACGKLYKQHKNIATAYDIEFRWIPIFINEQSYPMSALIRKTYDQDPEKGKEMMHQMMSHTWREDDHIKEIADLTAADYGLVKPAAAVFLAISKAMPGVGTPFVMFKDATGHPAAFSGVPNTNDWAALTQAE